LSLLITANIFSLAYYR